MIGFSTAPGSVRPDVGATYSADDFGKDIHHSEVHTPEAYELIARVQGFGALPDDWDGHGASAPSADIIDLAFDALTLLNHKGCLPTKVMPGVADDVGMLWERTGYRAILEVSLDGWDWSIEYHDGRLDNQYFEATGDVAECAEQLRASILHAERVQAEMQQVGA